MNANGIIKLRLIRQPKSYIIRPRGFYVEGETYVFNDKYRDLVLCKINGVNKAFLVRKYGTMVSSQPSGNTNDVNWENAQEFQYVATEIALMRKILAEEIDVKSLYAEDQEVAGFVIKNKKLTSKIKDANGIPIISLDGENGVIQGTPVSRFINIDALNWRKFMKKENDKFVPLSLGVNLGILYENQIVIYLCEYTANIGASIKIISRQRSSVSYVKVFYADGGQCVSLTLLRNRLYTFTLVDTNLWVYDVNNII